MATTINSPFFDTFPKIKYDINRSQYPTYETVTNIFMRFGILRNVVNNIGAYYVYDIEDGETPEIVAEKAYDDAGAGWIIIYANKIFDPQFDWPLDTRSFNKYIIGKYGSVANAQTQVHHYEKIIRRQQPGNDVFTVDRIHIDYDMLTDTMPEHINTYDTYVNLAATTEIVSVEGVPVVQEISKAIVSVYDQEVEENEAKRTIKVIKKEYYRQIMNEFSDLTSSKPAYIRRLA